MTRSSQEALISDLRRAEGALQGVGINLGAWAGIGDWATPNEDGHTRAGDRALRELNDAIAQLTALRDKLADAVEPRTDPAAETVRILIPDHPDLRGLAAQATQFVADMRATADPASYERDAEPWVLPEQLVDPRLGAALDAVLHPWAYAVGDEEQPTGISLRHAGVEHMSVFVAAATREQLDLLAEARNLLAAATDPRTARFQRTIDLVDFIDQNNDGGVRHAAIDAWFTMLRLFDVAGATAPVTEHRPARLIEGKGILVRQPDPAGTSPTADTELLLTAIDAVPAGQPVELDTATFLAYRRLSMEWHVAIYRDQADSSHATLQTWTY